MYYDDTRRRIITWVIIAAIVVCGCQVYKWVVMSGASRHLAQAEAAVKTLDQTTRQMQAALESAKNKHPANYLTGLRPDDLLNPLSEAKTLLEQAKKARHPAIKHRAANRIIAVCAKAGGISQSWQEELQFLDLALTNYEQEPAKLATTIAKARDEAGKLEGEGYFPENFREARAILDEAERQRLIALDLSKAEHDGGEKPDYRRVYRICLDSEKTATEAKGLILGVPRLRDSNASRATKLARDTETANASYKTARAAAAALEQYPSYRCLERVKQAKARLSFVQPLIDQAVDANSMQRQDFNGAAAMLSRADGILAVVVAEFDHAQDKQQEAANAIANADSARKSAVSSINRAQGHINYYSHNSQGTAKSRLNSARSELNQGDLLRASDPIASLASFQKANSEADSAYSAVDTSSDDDDTNWFSTSSSSSSDDGGGGSSGSGSSSGGGGFDWGGSSDSGGSSGGGGGGGEFGGPSGGESGGPSGGEFGGGL